MTVSVPTEAIERRWLVVDAGGQVLGRIASQVAHVLRGKHKPVYSPHVDAGDFVIVINAAQVRVTGRKREGKIYYRHTGYPGGVRQITAGELLDTRPDRAIEMAVRGMLPKTPLGRRMLRKLKVYTAADHPHAAQKPEPLEIRV
jgi:large subunit ribosomal protein L13